MAAIVGGTSTASYSWSTSKSDYEFFEKIGKGAFAEVFRARPRKAEGSEQPSDVAIKVMEMEMDDSKITQAEVLTMKSCNHLNVLNLFACFTSSDSKLYLVMPYMDRGSALHVMKKLKLEGKRAAGLNKGWVKYILAEVLNGLRYLHDNKIIHRDIKAGNILLNGRGNVMIADFGSTTFMQERGKDRQHATFTGTVCWMAPEVMAQEKGYSYPADVWSLGITALELVKGYAPYAMLAPMRVLLETMQQPPPTLKSYQDEKSKGKRVSGTEWANKSSSFKKFVAACLKHDPTERASIATLQTMKFVNYGSAGPEVARVMFARELCAQVIEPIHAGKESKHDATGNGKGVQNDESAENKESMPDWDFRDILSGDNDLKVDDKKGTQDGVNNSEGAEKVADIGKVEINDDNFGVMFSAAGLGDL